MALIAWIAGGAVPPGLLVALGLLGVGIIASLLVRQARERRRREQYAAYCLSKGYRFEPERPGAETVYAASFDLFTMGHGRRWGCTISGEWNRAPFTAFDYEYTTGHGRSSRHHTIAAMLWESAAARFPHFVLTPETFWVKIGQVFGMPDIDFAESPEFSAAYRLQGDDEPAIRRLFTIQIRSVLAAQRGQHVAGDRTRLLWWRDGRVPAAEELYPFLEAGDATRRLFMSV